MLKALGFRLSVQDEDGSSASLFVTSMTRFRGAWFDDNRVAVAMAVIPEIPDRYGAYSDIGTSCLQRKCSNGSTPLTLPPIVSPWMLGSYRPHVNALQMSPGARNAAAPMRALRKMNTPQVGRQ
jgi:hypothetical protein